MRSISVCQIVASRMYRDVFNYSVLIPDLGEDVNSILIEGDLDRYLKVLGALARGGTASAAAVLGYFHLGGAFTGKPDAKIAKEICRSPGQAGDAYCQYVYAWGCKMSGEEQEAISWMRRSAESGFSPAHLDLGRWVEVGIGVPRPDCNQAMHHMWRAHKLGHRAGLFAIARLLADDRNPARKLAGYLLWPIAFVRGLLFVRRNPFHEFAFGYSGGRKLPLLKARGSGPTSQKSIT